MTYNVKMDTNNGHIEFEGKADMVPDLHPGGDENFTVNRATVNKIFDKI